MESVIADPGLPAIASNDLRTRRRQLGVVGEPVQAHPKSMENTNFSVARS